MTAKEKAKELVDSLENYVAEKDFFGDDIQLKMQKKCALIAVDEILEVNSSIPDIDHVGNQIIEIQVFWQQVKQEIEHL